MVARLLLALLLAASPALAAHGFDSFAVNSYARSTSVEVTAPPLSMCCWVNLDASAQHSIIQAGDTASTNNYFLLEILNTGVVRAASRDSGATVTANTSTTATTGTWHHVCGVYASTTSRAAYLDGGGKGTNTTSNTPTSIDHTTIGINYRNNGTTSQPLDGTVAECAIYDDALSDGDVAQLGKGFAPPCVRPDALVAYYDMVRVPSATIFDRWFGASVNNLSIIGSHGVGAHPPQIIYCQ